MRNGDISNRPYPYVLFNFHEVVEEQEAKVDLLKKLMPTRYWKESRAGKAMMDRMFDDNTVCVLVYTPIKEKAEAWLLEHGYLFNKVLYVRDKQELDEYLTSRDVLGMLSRDGRDGFGRCCPKMTRWRDL